MHRTSSMGEAAVNIMTLPKQSVIIPRIVVVVVVAPVVWLRVATLWFVVATHTATTRATLSLSLSSSSSSSKRRSHRRGVSTTLPLGDANDYFDGTLSFSRSSRSRGSSTGSSSHSRLVHGGGAGVIPQSMALHRQIQTARKGGGGGHALRQLRGGDASLRQGPSSSISISSNSSTTTTTTTLVPEAAAATTTTTTMTPFATTEDPRRSILRRGWHAVVSPSQTARSTPPPPPSESASSLRTMYAVSFLLFFSSSIVALSPVQALQQRLDASRATQVLSALSATAALLEITLSSMVGRLLDVAGRKPALLTIVATCVAINACTALAPTVVKICAQKLLNMLAIGFFFLTSQTILSDIVVVGVTNPTTNPAGSSSSSSSSNTMPQSTAATSSLVSAAMGRQLALTGLGFLLGILGAGLVSDLGLSVVYSIASSMGVVALIWIQFGLIETMPKQPSIDTERHHNRRRHGRYSWLVLQSPLSCTRLLTRHGPRVRTLGLLLMLMTLPVFMGDFFQIFARQEWQLSTRSFSTFLALFGVVGIAANTAGSVLVKAWGIKTFTTVAVLSKLVTTVATVCFGYKGSIVGLALGFLGSAQSIGIVAALIAEGAKSGLPMGEMAGERASLMALLKVFGPIWYSTLYLQGQRWMQTSYLPFVFNIGLCLVALVVSQLHL